jgi:transposase, IS5 family
MSHYPTTRHVLHGETVPADEKLVSLFETHAEILVRDRPETYCGHKTFLTTGGSGLILDGAIPKGNSGDVSWTVPLMRRRWRLFGRARRQASFDGVRGTSTIRSIGRQTLLALLQRTR